MKTVILAGGLGTRLQEQTDTRPKPMVDIGGRPILWHIMKGYAAHGLTEFVVPLGYKGEQIKDYFLNYRHRSSSLEIHLASGEVGLHGDCAEDWTVHLLDTGLETQTGGRVKRAAEHVGGGTFLMTYGDGVADVDITALIAFHRAQGRLATVTAVRPPARFGSLRLDGDVVERFEEKPQIGEGWINGGFFVLEPAVADYIEGDTSNFERGAMHELASDRQLSVFRHDGFWQCMDTLRDLKSLQRLWQDGEAPWKVWE